MRVLVAGDYCPYGRVEESMAEGNLTALDAVRPWISRAHYSIVNFESVVVTADTKPIVKAGPAVKTTPEAVEMLRSVGFNCATLANNHFRDYGDEGCRETLDALRHKGLDYVGGGMSLEEAQRVLYKEIGGKRLAVVNFCENEFSIATPQSAGSAPLDIVDNYRQITQARKEADYVLVIVHGGHERYELPSPRMKKLYRHFVILGADAVVNHHQHCPSGYEIFEGKPIVYGLGNLCFDWKGARGLKWNRGYCVMLEFECEGVGLEILPYNQCDEVAAVVPMTGEQRSSFLLQLEGLSATIADDKKLSESFDEWVEERRNSILTLFSSYHIKFLNKLASKGIISRPTSRRELRYMMDNVMCESHRDVCLEVLKREVNM